MTPTDITALRLRLLACGYTPLPACGKEVYLKGWPTLAPTAADIANWTRDHPGWSNTGLATTNTPALDIDIMDATIADRTANLAMEHFGAGGVFLQRVGRAPKRAIVFQTPQPFAKRVAVFNAPDGKSHRIEILARGQQLVAYGIHPDTRQPYRWQPAGPLQVKRAQLPVISADTANSFIAAATSLLHLHHGWSRTNPDTDARPSTAPVQLSHERASYKLAGILRTIATAHDGNRNCVTFWGACRMAEMVAAGMLSHTEALALTVEAASRTGLSRTEALRTAQSALRGAA